MGQSKWVGRTRGIAQKSRQDWRLFMSMLLILRRLPAARSFRLRA